MEENRQRETKPDKPSQPAGKDNRTVSSFFSSRLWWILCLVLVSSYVLKLFFSPGHTYSLDGAIHTGRAKMVYESLLNGEFPLWSNSYWEGYPLLQYYPPLFFYLAGLINLIVGNLVFSIKLMAFAGQVLSGITVFLLVEEITDDRQAGFISGLGFALAPWHVYHILDYCRHTVIFIYPLLPLPFLFFEKYRRSKLSIVQAGILAGLSLSLLIAFEYGYAMFITLLFIFYIILDSISYKKPFFNYRHWLLLMVAGLVCLGTSLAFLGPFFLESQYVSSSYILSLKSFNTNAATLNGLFTRLAGPDFHQGYIGLSLLVLSLVGIFSALSHRRYSILIMYALCFYIVLGHQTSFYKYIPFIYTQQGTERLILYLILFMNILAGVGVKFLKTWLAPRFKGWVWPIIFILLAGICYWDMAVTKDRQWPANYPFENNFKHFAQSVSKYKLPHARTIRTMMICSRSGFEWNFDQIFPATLSIEAPTSDVGMKFTPQKIPYSIYGKKWVQRELDSSGGSELSSSQKLLYLMNVYVVFYINAQGQINIINNPKTTPAIGSGRLSWREDFSRPLKEDEEVGMVEPLINQMFLDQERNSARQLFLMHQGQLPDRPFNEESRLKVRNFQQTINKSFLEVETSHDCYLQLSHSYYPYLHIYLDGKEAPFYESVFGSIILALPKGQHRIIIEPYLSPLRKICYALSLISLLLALLLYRRFKAIE